MEMEVEQGKEEFKNRRWLLIAFCLVTCSEGMSYSIQAPFFPTEAESKNATATEYGFVFSSYELALAFGSGVVGTFITKFDSGHTFTVSMISTSISTVLFGFLTHVNDRTWFVAIAIILRVISAISSAVQYIAMTMFLNTFFQGEAIASNMNIGQAMFSVGLSGGPAAGAVLFAVGGFKLPFIVLGCFQLLAGTIVRIFTLTNIIPPEKSELLSTQQKLDFDKSENEKCNREYRGNLLKLHKIPKVFLSSLSLLCTSSTVCFFLTIMEPHLRQFNLSTMMLGCAFFYYGILFLIFSLVVSAICERIECSELINIAGNFLLAISSFLIGPDPHLHFQQTLLIVIANWGLLSIGAAAVCASSNHIAFKEAIRNGFPNDEATSALLSGRFLCAMGLGGFIGPIVAGILKDNFGFGYASEYPTAMNLTIGIAFGFIMCFKRFENFEKNHNQEKSEDKLSEEKMTSSTPLLKMNGVSYNHVDH